MKNKILVSALALLGGHAAHASTIVYGNSTTFPFGFTSPVAVEAYDRHTGTFYCGIESPSGDFSLAKALRPSPSGIPKFTGIGTDPILTNQTLESLIIIPAQRDDEDPRNANQIMLGMLIFNNADFAQTAVTVSTSTGGTVLTSASLNDATGNNTTSGICAIAANPCYVMAAVRPNNPSTAIFGDAGSGLALVGVQEKPLTLRTVDANTGLPGNLAVPFDGSITELRGGGPDPVIFSTVATDQNVVAMHYDEIFKRFYIGCLISTGNQAADIGKSVVVALIDKEECNRIELFPIAPDSAIDFTQNEIIVAQGTSVALSVEDIGVMHCSTGPDYLIINGGKGVSTQVGNLIFAMPLVFSPCDEEIHGTLADANTDLVSIDCKQSFTTPATEPGQLLNANDVRAIVGTGPVPIQPNQLISDMVVCADAVYVAIDIAPDCDPDSDVSNDTGIFYSQALFDSEGRIARWTPWKRATPFNAFPGVELSGCLSHDGQVKFFEVDAKTGSMWIVEGTTSRFIGYTTWSIGTCKEGLIKEVSELLCNGCYSALDLNQQTRGFLNATANRYALFGGVDRVAIARISIACDDTNPLSPEKVFSDFDCDKNMFIDTLPDFDTEPCPVGAGCVTALEYSRQTTQEGNENYFFAGTETGLYAFSDSGNGFNATALGELDQPPFIDGSWRRIEGIDGAVIDIKTSGAKLYVLTMNHSVEQPFISTLYSIAYADTLDTMFAEGNLNIIAKNYFGIFENTCSLFAMAIISTGAVADDATAPQKEQLILATSTGLYQSNANQNPGDGIIDATNQTEAAWELIPGTENICFDGIGFIDAPIEHTVWPISVADACQCRKKTFDRSDIDQLSGTGNLRGTIAEIGEFEPPFFNAQPSCNRNCKKFETLYPITYFWSDGGRRFFIINRTTSGSSRTQLAVMPFEVQEWNVYQFEALFNTSLQQFRAINWVRNMGASGLVMAGTNKGVIGLE